VPVELLPYCAQTGRAVFFMPAAATLANYSVLVRTRARRSPDEEHAQAQSSSEPGNRHGFQRS
jgi:hypothetical protein